MSCNIEFKYVQDVYKILRDEIVDKEGTLKKALEEEKEK